MSFLTKIQSKEQINSGADLLGVSNVHPQSAMRRLLYRFSGHSAALVSVGGAKSAHAASYNITTDCESSGSGGCSQQPSVGTVDVTGGGSSLTYTFSLTGGNYINQSDIATDVFMNVGGTISSFTANTNGGPLWTDNSPTNGDNHNFTAGNPDVTWTYLTAGLGTDELGAFNRGFGCNPTGSSTDCTSGFTVTFTGTNLAALVVTTPSGQYSDIAGVSFNKDQNFWCFLDNSCTDAPDGWGALVQTSTTPLPAAAWLFGTGLVGLGIVGRRGKKDSKRDTPTA